MDTVWIAQAVFDKAHSVTMPGRQADLVAAFERSGITIDVAAQKVTSVEAESSFARLSAELKSSLPTASIGAKRVLAEQHIHI